MKPKIPAPSWAREKKILLGISGGIAAYKTPELVRAWTAAGCEVEIIMTDAARRLVSPLALSTLSKRRAWTNEDLLSDENGWRIPHISLADWADVFVVAPCTANVLRMAAQGDSSTLLGAAMLACTAPVLLFPAMNVHMWENAATSRNARTAAERGYRVIDPDAGDLACGYEGKGRLPETEAITEETWAALCPEKGLIGKKVLITAGPTHEYIDPVRFISNPSSGKMGYALAREARYRGADVVLVSGPSDERPPSGVRVRRVTTALQMLEACLEEQGGASVVIKAAAVGDYRAGDYSEQKIKREGAGDLCLRLTQNPDIARELSLRKPPGQLLVGFAAETENVGENARRKIERKGLDLVVANDVTDADAGFALDTNRVRIYHAPAVGHENPDAITGSKQEVAERIWDRIASLITG